MALIWGMISDCALGSRNLVKEEGGKEADIKKVKATGEDWEKAGKEEGVFSSRSMLLLFTIDMERYRQVFARGHVMSSTRCRTELSRFR